MIEFVKPELINAWNSLFSSKEITVLLTEINETLINRCKNNTIYPPSNSVFSAFELTPLDSVKVVILGQDPYHGQGQAHGLAFSVPRGQKLPPSLRNIFKELQSDLRKDIPWHGDLSFWAEQGVLLLNTCLTVEAGKPASHAKIGWEKFTAAAIRLILQSKPDCVFILWGKHAQQLMDNFEVTSQHILSSPHPSPLSANKGFFGSKPFSKTNQYLTSKGLSPITWTP